MAHSLSATSNKPVIPAPLPPPFRFSFVLSLSPSLSYFVSEQPVLVLEPSMITPYLAVADGASWDVAM